MANYIVYKTGLDGRDVFSDASEYELWERLMSEYLVPFEIDVNSPYKNLRPYRQTHKIKMNLHGKVELLAYCLMPTHIYIVIREREVGAMTSLMRRVTTYYSMMYNRRRKRRGFVFEGAFKSREIKGEKLLVEVIRLVHQIPGTKTVRKFGLVEATSSMRSWEYQYSSMMDYISEKPRPWITLEYGATSYYKNRSNIEEDMSKEARELLAVGGGYG